jgi:hypothetical protein
MAVRNLKNLLKAATHEGFGVGDAADVELLDIFDCGIHLSID